LAFFLFSFPPSAAKARGVDDFPLPKNGRLVSLLSGSSSAQFPPSFFSPRTEPQSPRFSPGQFLAPRSPTSLAGPP